MVEVLPSGHFSLEEHVLRIQQSFENLRGSIFEVVSSIRLADEQLGHEVFGTELSEHLGMSPSTLSRWLQIGRSDFLLEHQTKLPTSFSGLYELTRLEKKYVLMFGDTRGHNKLLKLITTGKVNQTSEQQDIQSLLHQIELNLLEQQKVYRETQITNLVEDTEKDVKDVGLNLSHMIEGNETFRSFLVLPDRGVLSKWSDESIFDTDVYDDFPIADLRTPSISEVVQCFIRVPVKDIEVGLKILSGFGFTYRDMFVPYQPVLGYSLLKSEEVLLHGERGQSSRLEHSQIKKPDVDSLLQYVESVGSGPYLLVFGDTDRSGWKCLK